MTYVSFQIQGVLSSWGTIAIGDYRPTQDHPTRSAILGLVAGALGFERDSNQVYELESIGIAVCVLDEGHFLRDYHTVQVGAGKKYRDLKSRSEELVEKKPGDVMTMLTYRDYRADADYIIVLQIPDAELAIKIVDALKRPVFTPFLGRKSCPASVPFAPVLSDLENAQLAAISYIKHLGDLYKESGSTDRFENTNTLLKVYWDENIVGFESTSRHIKQLVRDKLIDRSRWQFANRFEHQDFASQEVQDALSN